MTLVAPHHRADSCVRETGIRQGHAFPGNASGITISTFEHHLSPPKHTAPLLPTCGLTESSSLTRASRAPADTKALLLGARMLLGAPGLTTRSKKPLETRMNDRTFCATSPAPRCRADWHNKRRPDVWQGTRHTRPVLASQTSSKTRFCATKAWLGCLLAVCSQSEIRWLLCQPPPRLLKLVQPLRWSRKKGPSWECEMSKPGQSRETG